MPAIPLSYTDIAADITSRIKGGEYGPGPSYRPTPSSRTSIPSRSPPLHEPWRCCVTGVW